jgi:hypothetical protein
MMQRYTHVKAEAAEGDLGMSLVVDAELFRLEGVVRWLDTADVRLSSRDANPMATSSDQSSTSDSVLERR